MFRFRLQQNVWLASLAPILLACVGWAVSGDRTQANVLRWTEGTSGCTFSADDDGKYRYGLWTDDFGIVIAVDADELRKASLRIEPLFAVLVTLRYRGKDSVSVDPGGMSLEFVKHYHALEKPVDPDELAIKLHNDADTFGEQMQREISKHPQKRAEKECILRIHEKDVAETQEFLQSRSLRLTRLDSAIPEVTGWVFFSARSKWIADWKKQEQFVLRVPIAGRVIEFPFALPPSQGDLLLRRR